MAPSPDGGAADKPEVFPAWCEDAGDVLDYHGVDDVGKGLNSSQVRSRRCSRAQPAQGYACMRHGAHFAAPAFCTPLPRSPVARI